MIHSVGEKPVFQCQLCPTTCGRKTDLRIHIQKLHTSDTPLKCRKCYQEFPDRYTYKIHAKTHEGEKCFKCEICPYASISARHLESHMLIHTDQKPFECQYCDQTFRQKQLLKRHENIYHNPEYVAAAPREKNHNCPTCDKAFRHKGNLMRHMASHELQTGKKSRVKAEQSGDYVVVEVFQEEEQYEDEEDDNIDMQEDEEEMHELEQIVEEDNYTLTESELCKQFSWNFNHFTVDFLPLQTLTPMSSCRWNPHRKPPERAAFHLGSPMTMTKMTMPKINHPASLDPFFLWRKLFKYFLISILISSGN